VIYVHVVFQPIFHSKRDQEKKNYELYFLSFSNVYLKNKTLGQINLISRLLSKVTKKYEVGGWILFYKFYFPK
jgi:hypothetical protein